MPFELKIQGIPRQMLRTYIEHFFQNHSNQFPEVGLLIKMKLRLLWIIVSSWQNCFESENVGKN